MAIEIRQSTATTVNLGPFIDDTDGKTAETALTITQADVRLSKNGGNLAQKGETSAAAHDELGVYQCALNTTDTATLGSLELFVHESGALPVWHYFEVVTQNYYDSKYSTDYRHVDAIQAEGDDYSNQLNGWVESVVEDLFLFYRLDELIKNAAAAPVAGSILGDLLADDAGTWKFSANALEEAPTGGGTPPTAEAIADAVLDEAMSGHVAAGSLGKAVADIEADTNELQTDNIPGDIAALNDLTAAQVNAEVDAALADYDGPTDTEMDAALAALNDLSAAQVNAEVDTALVDYDGPTDTEMDAALAALSFPDAAAVNAEVDTALADIRLDELFVAVLSAQPAAGSFLADLTEDDAGTQRFSTNALEQGASGGMTAADIADAICDESLSGHQAAGTVGAGITAAAAAIGGTGAVKYTYTVTNASGGAPLAQVMAWITSDALGTNILASGYTDANGEVVFYLDVGTIYVWRQKAGWNFSNPQEDTVS